MGKQMGRPPKPAEEVLAVRIDLRVTAAEKASFEEAAQVSGLSLSEWLRTKMKAAAKRDMRRKSE